MTTWKWSTTNYQEISSPSQCCKYQIYLHPIPPFPIPPHPNPPLQHHDLNLLAQAAKQAQTNEQDRRSERLQRDLKFINVEKFTGGSITEASEWIDELRMKIENFHIQQASAIGLFPHFLKGDATRWYSRETTQEEKDNWELLIQAFRKKYVNGDGYTRDALLNDFYSARLQSGESIKDFGTEFRRKGLVLGINEETILQQLWISVTPELRTHMKLQKKPNSFDDIISLLQAGQDQLDAQNASHSTVNPPVAPSPPLAPVQLNSFHGLPTEEPPRRGQFNPTPALPATFPKIPSRPTGHSLLDVPRQRA